MTGRGPVSMLGRYRPAPVLPDAMCAQGDHDSEAWFDQLRERDAIGVCLRCSERMPCLIWALAEPGLQGVFGGTSEAQRRLIRKAVGNASPLREG